MFIAFACSKQGFSHIKNGKPCEDYSDCFENRAYNTSIAIVADGHGGEKYFRSRYGSKLAVEAASDVLNRFIEQTGKSNKGFFNEDAKTDREKTEGNLQKLEKDIVSAWREKVLQHIKDNPWDDIEKKYCVEHGIKINENDHYQLAAIYGTTLLAVAATETFWFALQIGDGVCVVIHENGKVEIAVPDDEEQGFGITKSLCNKDALENFRHNFGFERILGITAATDGVSDSFPMEKYLEFNVSELLNSFVEHPEETKKDIEKSLPILSEHGSGDDVSIAGIFNQSAAKPILPIIVSAEKNKFENNQLKKENKKLKNEIDTLKQEAVDARQKWDAKEKDFFFEQAKRNEAEETIKQKENELWDKQAYIVQLESRCRQFKKDAERAENNESHARHERDTERNKRRKVEQSLGDEQRKRRQSEKTINDLQKRIKQLENQLKNNSPVNQLI
jgi:hypothetical protein